MANKISKKPPKKPKQKYQKNPKARPAGNQSIVKFRNPEHRAEQAVLRRKRVEELISLYSSGQLSLDKQYELQVEWEISAKSLETLMYIAKETIQFLASPISVYMKGCNFFDEVERDCLDSRINGQLNDHKVKNVLNAYKIKFAAVGLNQLRLNQSTEDINKLEKELTDKIINKLKSDGTIKEEDQEDIPDITN